MNNTEIEPLVTVLANPHSNHNATKHPLAYKQPDILFNDPNKGATEATSRNSETILMLLAVSWITWPILMPHCMVFVLFNQYCYHL